MTFTLRSVGVVGAVVGGRTSTKGFDDVVDAFRWCVMPLWEDILIRTVFF